MYYHELPGERVSNTNKDAQRLLIATSVAFMVNADGCSTMTVNQPYSLLIILYCLFTGSFDEYKKNLKTFGIDVRSLPYALDGSEIRVTGAHTKWIQKRRQKENVLILDLKRRRKGDRARSSTIHAATSHDMFVEFQQQEKKKKDDVPTNRKRNSRMKITSTPSCFDVIDIPGRHDVCLGRGIALHQHVGNVAMRAMMGPLLNEYNTATSSRRHELNKIIIQAIHSLGGRFLTNNLAPERAWFSVESDSNIENSIGSIFRSMVSRMNASHHQQLATPPP